LRASTGQLSPACLGLDDAQPEPLCLLVREPAVHHDRHAARLQRVRQAAEASEQLRAEGAETLGLVLVTHRPEHRGARAVAAIQEPLEILRLLVAPAENPVDLIEQQR